MINRIPSANVFNYPKDSPTKTLPFPNTSGEIDQGYFVKPPYPDKSRYHNATLSFTTHFSSSTKIPNRTYAIGLFVKDVQLGMSLSGSTAQSQRIRQFYAYNIELPAMTVTCQTRSSFEQSYIAEYIRFTQIAMVGSNISSSSSSNASLVKFELGNYHQNTPNAVNRIGSRAVTYVPPKGTNSPILQRRAPNGTSMGSRMGFSIYCFLTDVTRAVQVGENAYEFQIAVAIVDKNYGLPFSSNNSATDSIEGIQWTWEQINNATANGISFVQDPGVSVVEVKPHQPKKTGNPKSGGPPTVPPNIPTNKKPVIANPIGNPFPTPVGTNPFIQGFTG